MKAEKKEKANPTTDWGACLVIALIIGIIAFILAGAIFHDRAIQYFSAIFAGYLVVGGCISCSAKKTWFETINTIIGFIALLIGIVFEIRLKEAGLLGLPLIVGGAILGAISFIGGEIKKAE